MVKYTRIMLEDFDNIFDKEKIITNPEPIKSGEFTEDGIFSEKIFGPEEDIDNIDSIAWIYFGEDNYVIHPLAYTRIAKLIKTNVLDSLCSFNMRINEDGKFDKELDNDGNTVSSANIEDSNIGLWEFKRNFFYYLNKYTPEDKKSLSEYKMIIRWYLEGKIFINKIPVFSPKLRPAQIFSNEKSFQFSEINKYYNLLINHTNNLKEIIGDNFVEEIQLRKVKILYKVQTYVNKISECLIENIKGKRGIIRKNILGGRVNWSARNVISPNPDLYVDEIIVNYTTFINLYKIPLINLTSISQGIDFISAKRIIDKAENQFDKKVYRYMIELVKKTKGGVNCILNRNPSISVSSIQIVNIVDVIPDIDNYIMQVSNNVLSGMGADYDGDVLNLIALFSSEQYEQFKRLDPIYMVISNNDGNFNRIYALDKDNKLGTYLLNSNLGNKIEYDIID